MLVARGMTNGDIAAHLFLSEGTVKTHVKRIFSKLGLHDRTQAVILAYEVGPGAAGGGAPPSRPAARGRRTPGGYAGRRPNPSRGRPRFPPRGDDAAPPPRYASPASCRRPRRSPLERLGAQLASSASSRAADVARSSCSTSWRSRSACSTSSSSSRGSRSASGLVVVWVGIPILLVVAGAWWLFGAFERIQAQYLLGADVAPAPREWETRRRRLGQAAGPLRQRLPPGWTSSTCSPSSPSASSRSRCWSSAVSMVGWFLADPVLRGLRRADRQRHVGPAALVRRSSRCRSASSRSSSPCTC